MDLPRTLNAARESGPGLLVGLVAVLLAGACSVETVPAAEPSRAARAIPGEVEARFDYKERGTPPSGWTCTRKTDNDLYTVSDVRGEVTLAGDAKPTPVEIELWTSKSAGPRGPAVVVTPILGGGNDIARLVAREFAEAGLHGVIVWRGVKVLTPEWAPEEVEHNLRRAIVARRRAIDWLETRPEIDPRRIGAFGVSMGGIVTSVLASVEPRVSAAVIALAGGDLASVVVTSTEDRVANYKKARIARDGIDAAELERRLRAALVSDPALLAPYADPRQLLLFVARHDEVVPTRNQLLLRDALGRPRTFDMPTGHYTTMAYTPFVRSESTSFLLEKLATANPRVPLAR